MKISKALQKEFLAILDYASDEMSNAGCNDWSTTKAVWKEVAAIIKQDLVDVGSDMDIIEALEEVVKQLPTA